MNWNQEYKKSRSGLTIFVVDGTSMGPALFDLASGLDRNRGVVPQWYFDEGNKRNEDGGEMNV